MITSDNPPPGGGGKQKVSRPDVSCRLKQKKNILETVVPCALSGRLGVSLPSECRHLLFKEIDAWVVTVSKVVHRLSIIFNRLLLYLLQHKEPLPKFNTSLFTGMALHGMKEKGKSSREEYHSLIEDFCSNEFDVKNGIFPMIERHRGDCQAILLVCKKYETNFKNTIHVPFFTRQKSYIKNWMQVKGINGIKVWDVQKKINRWGAWKKEKEDDFPQALKDFILEEQSFFPVNLDEKWLKKNHHKVLSYYYRILSFYHTTEQGNKFRLAPLCKIKCHFLSIDNTVLREILINVRSQTSGVFPEDISMALDEKEITDDVWKSVFDYSGLRRKRQFGQYVDTDGEKICFHFKITKKKHNKGKRRLSCKRKRTQENQRIISIDPGRSNLITAWDEEKDQFYRLSRRQYYKSSGMLERTKKATQRNLEMKSIYEAMSNTSTRSIEEKDWFNYQMIITRHYKKLWEFKTRRVWRKEALRVSCLKEKCLDRFFNRFKLKGETEPLVVYGASCFHHTGKGELSVPVKYVYKKCCQRYPTVKENEKYTSLMHHQCQDTLMDVIVRSRKLRELRWCPTCRNLVSRDENASVNIKRSYESEERPAYLCDTYNRPKKKERGEITLSRRRRKTWMHNREGRREEPKTGKLELER